MTLNLISHLSDALDVTVSSSPQTVRENESVALKCKSNGVPKAKKVEWMFEDRLLGKFEILLGDSNET